MKKEYSPQEWTAREDYYVSEISSLGIPALPTSREILGLISKLDRLYTEASFDCALLKRKESRITLDMKNAEAEYFCKVKQQQLTAGVKVTEADIKGLVKTKLSTELVQGYGADIYSLIKAVMDRLIFMESVVKAIAEKKASIISATSMIKIENQVSPSN